VGEPLVHGLLFLDSGGAAGKNVQLLGPVQAGNQFHIDALTDTEGHRSDRGIGVAGSGSAAKMLRRETLKVGVRLRRPVMSEFELLKRRSVELVGAVLVGAEP